MNYKLTIYGNNMYEEFVLDSHFKGQLTMGTRKECQLCFQRERFLTDFVLRLERQELDKFVISCENTVYFRKNKELKDYVRILEPGDRLVLCYHESEREFFYIDFEFDFEPVGKDYNLAIDWKRLDSITVGGTTDSRIRIEDPNLENNCVKIQCIEEGYQVDATHTEYGICINGFATRQAVSNLHDGEFFSLKGYSFNIRSGVLYTTKNAVVFTDLSFHKLDNQKNYLKYPKFKRNVRQQYRLPDEKREILKPKSKDESEEQNFLLTFMPVVVNMLLMIVMRGLMGGGGIYILYFAGTMAVSSIVSLITFINGKKKRKEKEIKREEVYMKYISVQEESLAKLREKEKIIANQMHPKLEEYMTFIQDFDSRLFEKEKHHVDYLSVRLGDGIVESACQVDYKQEEYVETEDELMEYPKLLHDKYQYLNEMPVLLNLKNTNAVGFIGARTKLYQMEKNLIMEFAASHFYKDVKLFLIMDEEDVSMFEWARWLQNTYNDVTGTRNFMYDAASAKLSMEFLYSELSRREGMKDTTELEDYIIFVYKSEVISDHPVSEYVKKAKSLGFHFIFFEEHEELLNSECTERIFLNARDFSGYIQNVEDGQNIQEFTYAHIAKEEAELAAKRLACIYVDEVNLENSLTKNITLFELLDILNPYDLNLKARWEQSKIYESMAAPLGVKSGNEIVYLDLHEKYHGPHGLVAGTTGSGKSEIMQSYILSMATLFHPYEVGFIIIDFKGGGMANQFRNLPHLIGSITNIDGKEINRSLLSIKAELVKRQELFAEQNVNHINDYIRAYKERKTNIPLPHLILIVDEFAELKSDQPEFMKELISAARIGRSLGVHLILATQKPSGVVNDQIWSNSKFKLCLKVQNKSDSNEVLKSPLAAEIREPGRAYLQVGNNEIFQLFQSAYSGAPTRNDGFNNRKKFRISSVDLAGKRSIIYEQVPEHSEEGETQLDAMVSYIQEYCENNGIQRLPSICIPPLERIIPYSLEQYLSENTDITIPIGLADDPARQRQFVEELNFSQGNVFILGSSLSGKTCILQSIINGLAAMYSPKEVNIYILDFASMILKNFEPLKHIGGVITSAEDEKLKHFLKMLQEMIVERKNILSQKGLSSFSAYREAGEKDLPQVVVLMDNWISFKNYYPNYEEEVINIARECVSVGISLVLTASQIGGIGFKLLSNFAKRIALYCNDSGDYATLYENCRIKLDDIPGRGIAEISRVYYECQYYLAFAAEKEFERVKLIREFIGEINKKYDDYTVCAIPEIPEHVTEEFLINQYGKEITNTYNVLLGMDYNSITMRSFSLLKTPLIAFVGGEQSGRAAYVSYMLSAMLRRSPEQPIELYIMDDWDKSLSGLETVSAKYTNQTGEAIEVLNMVYEKILNRLDGMQDGTCDLEKEPLQVVVVHSMEMITALSAEKENVDKIRKLVSQMNSMKISFLFTNVDNAQISFSASELLKMIRDTKRYVIFEDVKEIKIMDVPLQAVREFKKEIQITDAYYTDGSEFEKLRMVEERRSL